MVAPLGSVKTLKVDEKGPDEELQNPPCPEGAIKVTSAPGRAVNEALLAFTINGCAVDPGKPI